MRFHYVYSPIAQLNWVSNECWMYLRRVSVALTNSMKSWRCDTLALRMGANVPIVAAYLHETSLRHETMTLGVAHGASTWRPKYLPTSPARPNAHPVSSPSAGLRGYPSGSGSPSRTEGMGLATCLPRTTAVSTVLAPRTQVDVREPSETMSCPQSVQRTLTVSYSNNMLSAFSRSLLDWARRTPEL